MSLHRLPLRTIACCLVLFLAALLSGCATALSPAEARQVAGKTYVVTGASSGLGRGVAERLGGMRANVVLAARRGQVLEEVAARITALGGNALVVPTDVAQLDDMRRLREAALARFGRIDVWINNAAVGAIGRFDTIPVEDHTRVVDVNLKGVIHGSHLALEQFKRQGGGTLVNIGSVESAIPLAYHASYAATKAAVLGLGRALNEELRLAGVGERIKVATVMPWAVDTPFFDHAANYSGRRGRMLAMDDPAMVVDVIVHASVYPREEVPAGWKARGALAAHWLAPDITESLAADIAHREQFEKAAPLAPTSGAVHRPIAAGTSVDGGVRARMQEEDAARESAPQP